MVRAVLFDLDDTLFDHRESAAEALRHLHGSHECFRATAYDEFERLHSSLLEALHPDVVTGRLGMDEARRERFRRLFQGFGVSASKELCTAVAGAYRRDYLAARKAMDGAAALLEAVRQHAPVAIVSNNMLEEQKEKLEFCKLAAYVDALVVSEEAGVSKPDAAIFRIALGALGVGPGDAVMVGDSWAADVVGARGAGIRAIWYNPLRLPSPEPGWRVPELYSLRPAADVARIVIG